MNGFWVMDTKPVSCIAKGLRLKDFEDEQRDPLTKRASLSLPLDYRLLFSNQRMYVSNAEVVELVDTPS